ncbi:unnamed protein product, partial [Meganyctiphanes norvegica]
MPHNNPVYDLTQSRGTVFIDASALGELSSQLTQHELEALVGLNIQAADLEALQEATDAHVVDHSGVLISDGVAVGNIVEVTGGGGGHGSIDETTTVASHVDHHIQSMEVDSLVDHTQVISDIDMLNQGGELLSMTTADKLGEGALLAVTSSEGSATHQILTDTPQILKSNLGQFVVLQQNQGLTFSSVGNRILTSSGQVVTSLAGGWSGGGSNKPIMVSAGQLSGGGGGSGNFRQQLFLQTAPSTSQQQQPQIRTVHMKQIPQQQQQQISNSQNVTRVIISSQAAGGSAGSAGNVSGGQQTQQQVRFVNAQQQGSNSQQNNITTPASPTKLTLQQAQQMGLISPSKTISHSPNKFLLAKLRGSRSIATKCLIDSLQISAFRPNYHHPGQNGTRGRVLNNQIFFISLQKMLHARSSPAGRQAGTGKSVITVIQNVTCLIISSREAGGSAGTVSGGRTQQMDQRKENHANISYHGSYLNKNVRFVNAQQQGSNSQQNNITTPASPTKLTLQQAQQMGLISPSKTISHSPNKVQQ